MNVVNEDLPGTSPVPSAPVAGTAEASSSGADSKAPQKTSNANACSSSSSLSVRRRRWDEAFPSDSEGSITPEPEGLQEENMDNVNLCTGSNVVDMPDKEESSLIVCEAHPGCLKSFATVREYEKHYNLRHLHKCNTCKKSLPSAHILELHVLEAHDTLFSLMAERKPMFSCFLESCLLMFWKSEERKEHCLSKHKFPKSFKLWNLAGAPAGGMNAKKSGPRGKPQQNQVQKEKNNKSGSRKQTEKMQTSSSTATDICTTTDLPATSPQPSISNTDTMEIDDPQKIKGKNQNEATSKPAKVGASTSKSKSKGKEKTTPNQITFGHSASRAFKPKHTFGLPKPVDKDGVNSEREPTSEMDMGDIKDVLLATTNTPPSAIN